MTVVCKGGRVHVASVRGFVREIRDKTPVPGLIIGCKICRGISGALPFALVYSETFLTVGDVQSSCRRRVTFCSSRVEGERVHGKRVRGTFIRTVHGRRFMICLRPGCDIRARRVIKTRTLIH